MKSFRDSYNISGDEMDKQTIQQEIYDTMQIFSIKARCYLSCVLNIRHKELLKQFLYHSGKYMQQFHAGVCSRGDHLNDLTVWKTLRLYCFGYSYRLYSTETIYRKLINSLSDEIRRINLLIAELKGSTRALMAAQSYLDLLLEYRYRVQASD